MFVMSTGWRLGTALVMTSLKLLARAEVSVTVPPGLEFWFELSVTV